MNSFGVIYLLFATFRSESGVTKDDFSLIDQEIEPKMYHYDMSSTRARIKKKRKEKQTMRNKAIQANLSAGWIALKWRLQPDEYLTNRPTVNQQTKQFYDRPTCQPID